MMTRPLPSHKSVIMDVINNRRPMVLDNPTMKQLNSKRIMGFRCNHVGESHGHVPGSAPERAISPKIGEIF